MLDGFKKFIARGNVVDLAIGIIMGSAFTSVVNSLVNDILMPPIGLLLGGVDFTNKFISLKGESFATLAEAQAAHAVTINYGKFINASISFLIVALTSYFLIKRVAEMLDKPKTAAPELTVDQKLLTEIRDSLKERG